MPVRGCFQPLNQLRVMEEFAEEQAPGLGVAAYLDIRDKLVYAEGETDLSFDVGQITLADERSQAIKPVSF